MKGKSYYTDTPKYMTKFTINKNKHEKLMFMTRQQLKLHLVSAINYQLFPKNQKSTLRSSKTKRMKAINISRTKSIEKMVLLYQVHHEQVRQLHLSCHQWFRHPQLLSKLFWWISWNVFPLRGPITWIFFGQWFGLSLFALLCLSIWSKGRYSWGVDRRWGLWCFPCQWNCAPHRGEET